MRMAPKLLLLMLWLGPAAALPALWDSLLPLTTDAHNQTVGYGGQRSIAADPQGNLHVVWLDTRTVPSQVWYRQYDNATHTWLPETMLVSLPWDCCTPTICCDDAGGRHVAWHVQEEAGAGVWYKRFSSTAHHWMAETLLVPALSPHVEQFPALACEPGGRVLHLAWFGSADTGMSYEVFHREFSPDSGWRAVEQLTDVQAGHQDVGVAADSTGHVCVVWTGYDFPGDYAFVYCRRRISGVWQATELVSGMAGAFDQYRPAIALGAAGCFHIAWYGLRSGYLRIYYRQFTPTHWLDVETVSVSVARQQRHVSLACGSDGVCHAVWSGQDSASPAHYQLRYSARPVSGGWPVQQTLTNIASGEATAPTIVVDGDTGLHVAWYDNHTGNNDIWYLRGSVVGTQVEEKAGGTQPPVPVGPTIVAGDRLRLSVPADHIEGGRVTVFDGAGRSVAVRPIVRGADGDAGISVAGLGAGLYFAVPDGPRRAAVRFIRPR